jgi:hypothetical protein
MHILKGTEIMPVGQLVGKWKAKVQIVGVSILVALQLFAFLGKLL